MIGEQVVTRRNFMAVAAAATAAISVGCPRRSTSTGVKVFKRSGRGVHVSNAAKKHNANRLYKTQIAALGDKPHKGDNSYVVELIISRAQFDTLFPSGRVIADLRNDL